MRCTEVMAEAIAMASEAIKGEKKRKEGERQEGIKGFSEPRASLPYPAPCPARHRGFSRPHSKGWEGRGNKNNNRTKRIYLDKP